MNWKLCAATCALALVATSASVGADRPGAGRQITSPRTPLHGQSSQTPVKNPTSSAVKELPTKAARLAFIRRARIWAPTNVSAMDLRAGPAGAGSFAPGEAVACDYVETKLPGTTRKFDCDAGQGGVVQGRYGDENGKVEGAVRATRLLS